MSDKSAVVAAGSEDRTLALLVLPDAFDPAKYLQIDAMIKLSEFEVVRSKKIWLTPENAQKLYPSGFKNNPEWVDYVTSGPCMALDLKKDMAVLSWLVAIGPMYAASQNSNNTETIRGILATDSVTCVAVDGSDEPEQAVEQLNYVFSSGEVAELPYDGRLMMPLDDNANETLAIIKPDVALDKIKVDAILSQIRCCGYRVASQRVIELTRSQAEAFYQEQKDSPSFKNLIDFMTSNSVIVLRLQRDDAVCAWGEIIGPTQPSEAKKQYPSSIRAKFGTSSQDNAVHGSDSPSSAAREIDFFFGSSNNGFDQSTLLTSTPIIASTTLALPLSDQQQQQQQQPPNTPSKPNKKKNKKKGKKSKGKQSVTFNLPNISSDDTTPLNTSTSQQTSDNENDNAPDDKSPFSPTFDNSQLDTIKESENIPTAVDKAKNIPEIKQDSDERPFESIVEQESLEVKDTEPQETFSKDDKDTEKEQQSEEEEPKEPESIGAVLVEETISDRVIPDQDLAKIAEAAEPDNDIQAEPEVQLDIVPELITEDKEETPELVGDIKPEEESHETVGEDTDKERVELVLADDEPEVKEEAPELVDETKPEEEEPTEPESIDAVLVEETISDRVIPDQDLAKIAEAAESNNDIQAEPEVQLDIVPDLIVEAKEETPEPIDETKPEEESHEIIGEDTDGERGESVLVNDEPEVKHEEFLETDQTIIVVSEEKKELTDLIDGATVPEIKEDEGISVGDTTVEIGTKKENYIPTSDEIVSIPISDDNLEQGEFQQRNF